MIYLQVQSQLRIQKRNICSQTNIICSLTNRHSEVILPTAPPNEWREMFKRITGSANAGSNTPYLLLFRLHLATMQLHNSSQRQPNSSINLRQSSPLKLLGGSVSNKENIESTCKTKDNTEHSATRIDPMYITGRDSPVNNSFNWSGDSGLDKIEETMFGFSDTVISTS